MSVLLFPYYASLLAYFVGFLILFHSCCSNARVLEKILVHEFPISYSHAEWYTFFFRVTTWSKWAKSRLSETNCNNKQSSRIIFLNVVFFSLFFLLFPCAIVREHTCARVHFLLYTPLTLIVTLFFTLLVCVLRISQNIFIL